MTEQTKPELLSDEALAEIASDLSDSSPSMSGVAGLFRQHCQALFTEYTALREQLGQVQETLTTVESCQNPKCGHCMALLRTMRRG